MFLVYDTEFENVKALFKEQGDANNYAQPNGWGVAPVKVTVPFYVAINPS